MELLSSINFWHWLIVAAILLSVEMMIGAYYFLWMGIAAVIVGGVMFFMPSLSWLAQVIIFTVLSLASFILFKKYQKRNPVISDQPALNKRGQQYVGRVFTLNEPIVNGIGKVKVDDTTWKVSGEDRDAGAKVRVVAVDGTIFKVESA
jgi:hypothetical protein